MSKAEFTKGPWTQYGLTIQSGRNNIAYMGEPTQYAGDTPNMCYNWEANAHLIAAAPDLYEALENLIAWIDPNENYDEPETNAAYAALAKARGEAT